MYIYIYIYIYIHTYICRSLTNIVEGHTFQLVFFFYDYPLYCTTLRCRATKPGNIDAAQASPPAPAYHHQGARHLHHPRVPVSSTRCHHPSVIIQESPFTILFSLYIYICICIDIHWYKYIHIYIYMYVEIN